MKYGIGGGMKWTIGQKVTSLGQTFTVTGRANRGKLVICQRDSDGTVFGMHEHCFAEHPINGGNYGESQEVEGDNERS